MPKKKQPLTKEETVVKESENVAKTKQPAQPQFYAATGGRKTSTARVRLYTVVGEEVKVGERIIKKGEIVINNRLADEYFRGESITKQYLEPFRTTNTLGRFATSIKVSGGGLSGQMGAVTHGIARALLGVDEERFRPILRKRGVLTRDPREKERRKAGYAGKARARKQSPKR